MPRTNPAQEAVIAASSVESPWPLLTVLTEPEVGVRLIAYCNEIGLSEQRKNEIVQMMKSWRQQYGNDLSAIAAKAREMAALYHNRVIPLDMVYHKIDEYTALVNAHQKSYARVLAEIGGRLTEAQYQGLSAIHESEKSVFPPRSFGVL